MNSHQPDIIQLLERVCASTIATNAALKCMIAGKALTVENVIAFVGDFFDPAAHNPQSLIDAIEAAIEDMVGVQSMLKPARMAANQN